MVVFCAELHRASSQASHLNLKRNKNLAKHNEDKNPNWAKADQLTICKHERGVKRVPTVKKLRT